jgi:hypothetical protein
LEQEEMGKKYFPWLLGLAGLFLLRVLAQLIQAIHPVSFLPPFQAWHGAVLPYPVLFFSQAVIIVVLAVILFRVKTDAIIPNPWKYRACFTLGGVYFVFMAFRLISGLTFLDDHPWFSKHLPAFFHTVLASFVLLLGHYIYQRAQGGNASKTVSNFIVAGSYPVIILLGLVLFQVASEAGMSIAIASYAAVLIGAALITCHEIKLPYRKEWKPTGSEIGHDALFMMIV